MQSILIISQDKQKRETFATQLCESYQIDQLDRTLLRTETSIGIKDIRQLQQSLQLKPFKSAMKAAIIYDGHTMTTEAQNAFLKTLEEPPNNTYIIVTAETDTAFLPTILSRCKIITLEQPARQLSKEDEKIFWELFITLNNDTIGDKLYLAQIHGEKKETALAWLENAMFYLRNQLLIHTKNIPLTTQTLFYLEQFQETYRIIKTTNVNPRFALENLLLSL